MVNSQSYPTVLPSIMLLRNPTSVSRLTTYIVPDDIHDQIAVLIALIVAVHELTRGNF